MNNLKNTLIIILLSATFATYSQSNKNYIIEKGYIQPRNTSSFTPTDYNTYISYFDGLGRKVQEITTEQDFHNLVKNYDYDENNILEKEYLSHATPNLDFVTNSKDLLLNTYNVSNPYSENKYDKSDYKIIEQGFPGNAWSIENPISHTVKKEYKFNVENEVKQYVITSTLNSSVISNALNYSGYYPKNTLRKEVQKNENWEPQMGKNNTTELFFNEDNLIVLSRLYNDNISHDTYYLYNKLNQCVAVLPPMANGDVTTTTIEKWCYLYNYDIKGRLVEKKLPQKEWQYIIYDNADRVVMTGPVYNPFGDGSKGWLVVKYDALGREVYTGYYEYNSFDSATRNSLAQNSFVVESKSATNAIDGVLVNYTNASFPTTFKLLNVNYYDDYMYPNAPTWLSTVENQTVNMAVKGLLTGVWTRVLTTSLSTTGISSYNLYDNKYRVIRSYTTNHLGGYIQVDRKLNFTGMPTKTITYQKHNSNAVDLTITNNLTYDRKNRLTKQSQQINSGSIENIVSNEYDELGFLVNKNVGGRTGSPLEKVHYKYNVRGWLTDINNADMYGYEDEVKLFNLKLNYDRTDHISQGKSLYNGNINSVFWRTKTDGINRGYFYDFDHLNRLKDAHLMRYSSGWTMAFVKNDSYNESLTYDKNSNILSLKRSGGFEDGQAIEVDDLIYTYNANQLQSVTDGTNNAEGFKSSVNSTQGHYVYDSFGNVTQDKNKGITAIAYNHLNLPKEVVFNTGKITYIYDATGTRLSKKVTQSSGLVVTTDYLNGFQYENGVLQFFPHAEGYVKHKGNNQFMYAYQYKDHLGNVRLSYADCDGDGTINPTTEILEENNYYPFGLKHKGYNEIANACRNESAEKYKFGGKEWNSELGLDLYDFGARNYDPALGRWLNVDPLAENSRRWTPYNYAYDNPIVFVDPDGMQSFFWDGWIESYTNDGDTMLTYDAEIYTKEQAIRKGYKNVASVSESLFYTGIKNNESYSLNKDGSVYNNNTGASIDVGFNPIRTNDGIYISENNQLKSLASGLQNGGDALTYIGLALSATGAGAPVGGIFMSVGGGMSLVGTGVESGFLYAQGEKGKAGTKFMMSLLFIGTSKLGVKAAEKSVGKGLDTGTKTLIDGTNIILEKTIGADAEKMLTK